MDVLTGAIKEVSNGQRQEKEERAEEEERERKEVRSENPTT